MLVWPNQTQINIKFHSSTPFRCMSRGVDVAGPFRLGFRQNRCFGGPGSLENMHVDQTYVFICGGSLLETLSTSHACRYLTRVHAVTDFADFSTEKPRNPPPRVYPVNLHQYWVQTCFGMFLWPKKTLVIIMFHWATPFRCLFRGVDAAGGGSGYGFSKTGASVARVPRKHACGPNLCVYVLWESIRDYPPPMHAGNSHACTLSQTLQISPPKSLETPRYGFGRTGASVARGP